MARKLLSSRSCPRDDEGPRRSAGTSSPDRPPQTDASSAGHAGTVVGLPGYPFACYAARVPSTALGADEFDRWALRLAACGDLEFVIAELYARGMTRVYEEIVDFLAKGARTPRRPAAESRTFSIARRAPASPQTSSPSSPIFSRSNT